jgi:hypothetical protein
MRWLAARFSHAQGQRSQVRGGCDDAGEPGMGPQGVALSVRIPQRRSGHQRTRIEGGMEERGHRVLPVERFSTWWEGLEHAGNKESCQSVRSTTKYDASRTTLSPAVRGAYGVWTQLLACKLAIGPQPLEANLLKSAVQHQPHTLWSGVRSDGGDGR